MFVSLSLSSQPQMRRHHKLFKDLFLELKWCLLASIYLSGKGLLSLRKVESPQLDSSPLLRTVYAYDALIFTIMICAIDCWPFSHKELAHISTANGLAFFAFCLAYRGICFSNILEKPIYYQNWWLFGSSHWWFLCLLTNLRYDSALASLGRMLLNLS